MQGLERLPDDKPLHPTAIKNAISARKKIIEILFSDKCLATKEDAVDDLLVQLIKGNQF